MEPNNLHQSLPFANGPTLTVVSPCHNLFEIRERNGEDEDILSKVKDNQDGTAINNYLSHILVNPRLTPDEVNQLPSKTRYYLVLMSRIQSLGHNATISHIFQDDTKEYSFEVDLRELLLKSVDDISLSKYHCTEYPESIKTSPYIFGAIPSGVKFRMQYLTGVSEKKALEIGLPNLTINKRLVIREFEIENHSVWQKIENFRTFTSKDMVLIRGILDLADKSFDMQVDLKNPNTGKVETISLLQTDDFFFPKTL